MSGHAIPMTTGAGMGPLPEVLAAMASERAVLRCFSQEGLPHELVGNREIRLPLVSLMNLFERGGREAGDRAFGLRVGEAMTPDNYGLWAEYALGASSLHSALVRIVGTIDVHQTGSRMSLRRAGGHMIWGFHPQTPGLPGIQHADHIIPVMRRFVGKYLGDDWAPPWIELNYPRDPNADAIARFWQSELRFAAPAAGIAIPIDSLSKKRDVPDGAKFRRSLTSLDLVADARRRHAQDPVHAIEDIVTMRLFEGNVDIDGVALLTGTSVRTLQRMLDEKGYSYRQLLDLVRYRRGVALIKETNASITEIALMLGYSETANFTRAFHRWSGQAPSALRNSI